MTPHSFSRYNSMAQNWSSYSNQILLRPNLCVPSACFNHALEFLWATVHAAKPWADVKLHHSKLEQPFLLMHTSSCNCLLGLFISQAAQYGYVFYPSSSL